ncbi:MAG: hypothetical protein CMJ57_11165 [Planctomycetaceae bacterium]|nr:hypothetical protein [Planctomycetaceae bacterium]
MSITRHMVDRFLKDERGSVALEYALTGMVSGGATVLSMSMVKNALDDLRTRTEFMFESVLLNS